MGNCWRKPGTAELKAPLLQQWRGAASSAASDPPECTPEGNPLPEVVHKVIRDRQLGPGRLVLVGDVHGCLEELLELLDTVRFRPHHDNLVFTGDLVNKGPRSQEVLALLRVLSDSGRVWSVRGNNDDSALAAWRQLQQGIPVAEPKHAWVSQLLEEDVALLMQLPFSLSIPGYNLRVVHAGLLPGLPLKQQDLALVATMRDILQGPDGSLLGLERAVEGSKAWAGWWQGPQHVVFGHDSVRRLQSTPTALATGIDCGCCYGGQLAACVLPPLLELQQSGAFQRCMLPNGPAPTLRDLNAVIVAIPSSTAYVDP